ncbi:hypothetical protein [Cryobacterium frigoriphilum]|uniref:hypothetical protein n=1 Tax=Cryobacterium frigoriphilum TaxID=1259150 RepID=UPI00141AAD46|nr:hypothetical protein [Cryobacterium frigoriphilum]
MVKPHLKSSSHHLSATCVGADVIMDQIIHNTTWVDTGTYNMREQPPSRPRNP